VTLDGALGEEQLLRYLAVHVSHHDQPENLLLAGRECRRLHLSPVRSRYTDLTGAHSFDAWTEHLNELAFKHNAACPRAQRGAYLPALDGPADQHDRRTGKSLCEWLDQRRECAGAVLHTEQYDRGVPAEMVGLEVLGRPVE
jgi:hypothetical protein